MIRLKSQEEIQKLQEGGQKLSEILGKLKEMVKPGVFSNELEDKARELIKEAGGEPAFLGYAPKGDRKYPSALCLSVNDDIVHCPAGISREIKHGDVVSLDLGFKYKGLITDMATTVDLGNNERLLNVTKTSLEAAIRECVVGAPISNVGRAIQDIVESAGFSVIHELVGHGVGYDVHEDPIVPNYEDRGMKNTLLEEGLVIAIEPMVAVGGSAIKLSEDSWSYSTVDGSKSAHFEATVAITKEGPKILTPIV